MAVACNDSDENPFDIPLAAVIGTGLLQSPDLGATPFMPWIDFTPTFNPVTGEILLEFSPPSPDAHFFQVFGKVPE